MKIIQKLLLTVVAAVLLRSITPLTVSAASIVEQGDCGATGSDVKYILYDDGELVISGSGGMKDFTRTFQGVVDTPWYSCRDSIKKVTIQSGVTKIGDYAFYGCTGLTSVTIPNNVACIGNHAFTGCTRLTSIIVGKSVTTISNYAFFGCSGLTSVTIPDSVTSIGDYAFFDCSGLTSVTIPNSVTSIGDCAFRKCTGLTSVTIPDSVASIGDYAFFDCSGLTSVTIPDSVTRIGISAFKGCTELTGVTIGNSVQEIVNSAFSNCTGLTSVTIPDSVTSIDRYAFYNCTGLTSATIGSGVADIDVTVFDKCTNLNTICFREIKAPTMPGALSSVTTAYYPCAGEGYEEFKPVCSNAEWKIWHDYEWTILRAPTKDNGGMASGACRFDSSHTEVHQINALSDSSVWKVSIKMSPTYTEQGEIAYSSEYGEVTAPLAALSDGSVWTSSVTLEPTCTEDGARTYISEYGAVTEPIPAGHSWVWTISLEPTETDMGMATAACAKDSSHADKKMLQPLNDTTFWTKGAYTAPTLTSEGAQEYISEYGSVTVTLPKLTNTDPVEPSAPPYKVTSLVLRSGNGTLTAPPENGGFLAEMSVTKTAQRSSKDYFILIAYDANGAMLGANYAAANIPKDAEFSFGITFPVYSKPVKKIKAFVWDSLSGMTPLSESVER